MTAMTPANNPYLSLPLEGVRLIEASAGTGKTFTLATLFTRLVVERGLRIGQILAVTFTEAATQELRKRIRERLLLAASLVETSGSSDDDNETVLTRAILRRHLADSGESPQSLSRRLRIAAEEIDLASIFTIHGFCARVLSEHALESGHGFAVPELLANTRALHEEVAADLWRRHTSNEDSLDALLCLWRSPKALAQSLAVLTGPLPLFPVPAEYELEDPRPRRVAVAQALAAGIRLHGEEYFNALLAAVAGGVLNKTSYKADWIEALGQQLQQWSQQADPQLELDERLGRLTLQALNTRTNKAHIGKAPVSALQPLIADHVELQVALAAWRRSQAVLLLHSIRDEVRQRLALLKQQHRLQTYDDLIDGVADALEGPQRQRLVAQLRAQYRFALVDEFQDTDERQWNIFRCVFGDSPEARDAGASPALFLIGDPKQAIYGFRGGDVQTYLQARAHAEAAPALDQNFRSRPGVLRAIQALYENAGEQAFVEAGIHFVEVNPGDRRSDADYTRGGFPAPALTLRILHSQTDKPRADSSRAAATAACVADIHRVLSDARAGSALIDGQPVQPGDIAVLVRSHREATRIQQALALAGIPAIAAGKQSLFATREATELQLLLLAVSQPADEGRLRAALSTVLLGRDANDIARLDDEADHAINEQLRIDQGHVLEWRERWQRSGPFALVADLCAQHAERLLGLFDGERRLTNYLQLAEQLQQASIRALGMPGLIDWLQQQITLADANDETQLLRLESDAHRVQVITLHKSKGLEYPLVYLPFVGLGTGGSNSGSHHVIHHGGHRQLHWKLDKEDVDWVAANQLASAASDAEDARLLYVGLTRAEHALWIAAGQVAGFEDSRLAPMLEDALDALRDNADVLLVEGLPEPPPPRLPPVRESIVPPARIVTRSVPRDWWVYSFTQLAKADSGAETTSATVVEERGADDEPLLPAVESAAEDVVTQVFDPRFSGSRFGNVLHDALEHADFADWRGWQPGATASESQLAPLREALQAGGYIEADIEDGVAALVPLVGQTLTVALPEGIRLADLPGEQRRAEIEFHFALQSTSIDALLHVLHAHGVVPERRGFGLRRQLEGLMTGKIDLTYTTGGRWYVLDYKSNRLPGYDAPQLAQAMAHSEYDLQALVYTLALHRWLRFRLGDDYDYARDFGGIRYLFCRGLQADRNDSPGVHAQVFPVALVEALDRLFAGGQT